jgi:hypothetical protein
MEPRKGTEDPFAQRERNGELVAVARAGHVPTTLPEPLHDPVIHAALDEAARLSMSDEIGVPSTHLARLARNYWAEAAASGGQSRMRDFAMDAVDYVAMLVERGEPGGDWEAVYDTWLARAARHAVNRRGGG